MIGVWSKVGQDQEGLEACYVGGDKRAQVRHRQTGLVYFLGMGSLTRALDMLPESSGHEWVDLTGGLEVSVWSLILRRKGDVRAICDQSAGVGGYRQAVSASRSPVVKRRITLQEVLVDIVNTVSDWPQYRVKLYDDPLALVAGFQVGTERWPVSLHDIKKGRDELEDTRRTLLAIREKMRPLPLRPWPEDQVAREVHVRVALLNCAVQMTTLDERENVAWWATFLGRLRAGLGPLGNPMNPRAALVHDSIGMPLQQQNV